MSHPAQTERRIRVLCVDDSDRLTSAWQRLLGLQPDMVSAGTAADARGLAEVIRERRPHVVLLDLGVLGEDPRGAIRSLSAACPGVLLIVYSGRQEEEASWALEAGAAAYVGKHEDPTRVLEEIRRLARGSGAEDQP